MTKFLVPTLLHLRGHHELTGFFSDSGSDLILVTPKIRNKTPLKILKNKIFLQCNAIAMQSREIASNAMQSQRDSQNSTAMQCNFSEIVRAMQSQCNPKTRLLADPWSKTPSPNPFYNHVFVLCFISALNMEFKNIGT